MQKFIYLLQFFIASPVVSLTCTFWSLLAKIKIRKIKATVLFSTSYKSSRINKAMKSATFIYRQAGATVDAIPAYVGQIKHFPFIRIMY